MTDKNGMMGIVYRQLALDYNCVPDDFIKEGLIFTEAKINNGRRPFPFIEPRLEVISFGTGVIINASASIMPAVRRQFEGKSRDEVLCSRFVCGLNPYFLPDTGNIPSIEEPEGFEIKITDSDIPEAYINFGLLYDPASLFPDDIIVSACCGGRPAGFARSCIDSTNMRQINIDVLPEYRRRGLAAYLVNILTNEVLSRGLIPYYFTSFGNIPSMRTAVRNGYSPAWVHSYRARLNNLTE